MSVLREAANVLPVIAGIRDSAVQLVSVMGSVVIGGGSKAKASHHCEPTEVVLSPSNLQVCVRACGCRGWAAGGAWRSWCAVILCLLCKTNPFKTQEYNTDSGFEFNTLFYTL